MVSSRALTVEQYLAELPRDRREVISALRDVVNRNVPPGYVERMNWGMICWEIPLARYPHTYNGYPLGHLALAAQKNNYAIYTLAPNGSPELAAWMREEYRRAGQKLDMGKSCTLFRKLEGMPMSVLERLAAFSTVEQTIEDYERGRHGRTKPATKPAPRKTARVAPEDLKPASKKAKAPAARTTKRAAPAKRKPAGRSAKPAARKPAAKAKRR